MFGNTGVVADDIEFSHFHRSGKLNLVNSFTFFFSPHHCYKALSQFPGSDTIETVHLSSSWRIVRIILLFFAI
jgi:hypothetical protein